MILLMISRLSRVKKYFPVLVFIVFGLSVVFSLVSASPGSNSPNTFPISSIRSTTYYNFPKEIDKFPSTFLADLNNDIQRIKSAGFNTLWFVVVMENYFNSDGSLKTDLVSPFKDILNFLRANNMKVILPLTYGGLKCQILTDPQAYNEYVRKHNVFLKAIEGYADMSYIMVFTESVWGCEGTSSGEYIYTLPKGGEKLSKLIQPTLGRLPLDLDPTISSKFIFGFHDSFTPEGWNQGTSSVTKDAYNFFSYAHYDDFTFTNSQIQAKINNKISNIRKFFPSIPVLQGELGSSWCKPSGASEATQSQVIRTMTSHLISKGVPFNVWMWKPIFADRADSLTRDCNFGGNSITFPDGTFREIIKTSLWPTPTLSPTLSPTPTSTPSPIPTPSFSPTPSLPPTPTFSPIPSLTPSPSPFPARATSSPSPAATTTPIFSPTPTPPPTGGPAPKACNFTRDIYFGSIGEDVRCLQKYLNSQGFTVFTSGFGSPGNETVYFGFKTRQAVARWQSANNVFPTFGYFGPKSRAKYYGN